MQVLEINFRASCCQPLARCTYRRRQEIFGWRKENWEKGASLLASIGNHFSRELQSGLHVTFRASCGQPLARAKYRRCQEIFGWRKENYKKGTSLLASIGNHFSRELQSGLDVTFRASCGLPLARANSRQRQGGQREIYCCRLAVAAISSATASLFINSFSL